MSVNAQLLENDYRMPATTETAARQSVYAAETLVGGAEIIRRLAGEWIALCEEKGDGEPFARPEWFAAFAANFEREIVLVIVRKAGKLRAVLPLVEKKTRLHGVPVVKLGALFNLQSQRFDLIHGADESEKTEVLTHLWNEIKRRPAWHVFETRLSPADGWLRDLLRVAEADNYPAGAWKMDAAPFVALPQSADKEKLVADYFKNLSKNRRKLLNKNLRHLQEAGVVEFTATREYSAELMKKYFALEAQSWKGRAGTDAAADEKIARLHEDFARACAAQNALIIHELKLDGATIAMYLSITFEPNRTIGWKMSFDENYAGFSPGNVLFKEVLSECLRGGSAELDMLSPVSYNKTLFASGQREHAAFYIFRRGLRGALLKFWKFSAADYARRFKREK